MGRSVYPKKIHEILASEFYPKLPDVTRNLISEQEFAKYILDMLISSGDLEDAQQATSIGESHGLKNTTMSAYEYDDNDKMISHMSVLTVYPTAEGEQYVQSLINSKIRTLNKQLTESKNRPGLNEISRVQCGKTDNILFDNPFYVLDASITDNRRKIAALCEDKSLYIDSKICEDARAALITPQRRLNAEMHWFPDCDSSEISHLLAYVKDTEKNTDAESEIISNLCSLSQLNAYVGSFAEKTASTYQELKRDILRISRLFEDLNPERIRTMLNEKRLIAGFPTIETTNDIISTISQIRSEIKKSITQKLSSLNSDQYIAFVTIISESYSSARNRGQAVLEDIITEYELKINDTLEDKAKSIIRMADFIAKGADRIDVDAAVADILKALSDWDRIAQPMQLSALTKGDSHTSSAEMFTKMRNLAIALHNNFGLSEQALTINTAMKTVFAEMPEHMALLKEDEEILKGLIQGKIGFEHIKTKFEYIDSLIAKAKSNVVYERKSAIDMILSETKELYAYIQNNVTGAEKIKTQETLGFTVRGLAIELANDKKDFESSLRIINSLLSIYYYADFNTLVSKLRLDKSTLEQTIQALRSRVGYQSTAYSSPSSSNRNSSYTPAASSSSKNTGRPVRVLLVCLAIIVGVIFWGTYQESIYTPSRTATSPSTPSQTALVGTTVTLNKEGGSGGTSSVTATYGKSMPSASAPTKSGYIFKGYYSSPDGNGSKYYDSNMNSVKSWDIHYGVKTLYAYWEQIEDKAFSQSLTAGEKAYIDVSNVFPAFSITSQQTRNGIAAGLATLKALVLECHKQEGDSSKYVYIKIPDYKTYIDPDASTYELQYSNTADTVYLAETKRIHGTVRIAENMCEGLSKTTGRMILEFSSIETISSNKTGQIGNNYNGNSVSIAPGLIIDSSLNRPQNGYVFYYKYADQPCTLEITNKNSEDMYCKFVDKYGNDTNRFYVRSNSTAKIAIPVGDYTLKFATGTTWISETSLFGSSTQYYKDPETYTCSWGTRWTVTYYISSGSSSSADAPRKISASDF